MEIEYELTKDDIVEFDLYYLNNSPLVKKEMRNATIILASVGIALIVIGFISFGIAHDYFSLFFFSAFGMACIFALRYYNPSSVRQRIVKAVEVQNDIVPNDSLCKHKQSISDEGLSDKTAFDESKVFWSGIREIKQVDKYLYFFQLRKGGAYIIPMRSFPDKASFNLFAQAARDFHAKALAEKAKN